MLDNTLFNACKADRAEMAEYLSAVADGACMQCAGGMRVDCEIGITDRGRPCLLVVDCDHCDGTGFERSPALAVLAGELQGAME